MANDLTLGRALLRSRAFAARSDVSVSPNALLELPDKAVQFGTGAFLRGFVEFFLDQSNRRGVFNGRVVLVGSTGSGRDHLLNEQDGLYTLSIQGMEFGLPREENQVISSVSRALSASDDWRAVLECARNPALELIFSNTTEVGIVLDDDDRPELNPPQSFPGKLTRFLYERARSFAFAPRAGVVVLPCELIENNGDRLRDIVLTLAERWALGDEFQCWVHSSVIFCNTLVDRIVTGPTVGEHADHLTPMLGYSDAMLTVCEVYRLFVIEGNDTLRARIGFADQPGIIITSDITPYRERKVRLLNGTHTISVPVALLCGCETVREALDHPAVGQFIRTVLFDNIVPSVGVPGTGLFAREVLDRFANPYIDHALMDITLQGTMKMRVRVIPSILEFVERRGSVPQSLAFGFAAYLHFMNGWPHEDRRLAGSCIPSDDQADHLVSLMSGLNGDSTARLGAAVHTICSDTSLWGADLSQVHGFADAVTESLARIHKLGPLAALGEHLAGVALCK